MAKVTITIDDTNPALVAAFGENTLETIANEFGYMEMVEKDESELPEKVEVDTTDPDGNPTTVLQYPEGTEMYKANPQSRSEFVADRILENQIVPILIQKFADRKKKEALESVEQEVNQAKSILKSAAVVETT